MFLGKNVLSSVSLILRMMIVKTSVVDVTAKPMLFIAQEVFNRLLDNYKFEKFAGDAKEASE